MVQALSQDDSFFENVIEEISGTAGSDKDMFEESDSELESTSHICDISSVGSKLDKTVESQGSSLPSSVLDIRAKALEEIQNKAEKKRSKTPQKESQVSRVVVDKVDLGPFFGLPSAVKELYIKNKGVTNLFLWQEKCLKSAAVKNKSNFLYSLPTSGGKTLVAEIIMLQELLCYKKNVIFILPYVSIVQEKIRSMTPFALELGFCLEEYAGPKGKFPPAKRLHKRTLYICTIEKAHALFNSLVSEGREKELGLLVIDEIHMLGEGDRGANLESLLVKVKHVSSRDQEIQMVAMSATVGNLRELSTFLQAELFTDDFRPVTLEENLKVGRDILTVQRTQAVNEQFKFKRKVEKEMDSSIEKMDEDGVTDLVLEVFPEHSVLVFCDSKRRCENVSELLAKIINMKDGAREEIFAHKGEEKKALLSSLGLEGSGFICPVLAKTIRFGVAYHHSGLTMDERKLLEDAFLTGTLGVLCCTSTLAAGVNLPARRVIIRSPFMGRAQLTNAQYRQMVGRAGRAGLDTHGESFLLVKQNLTRLVPDIVTAPVEKCVSHLDSASQGKLLSSLILNCVHLGLVSSPSQVSRLLSMSLLTLQRPDSVSSLLTQSLQCLLDSAYLRSEQESASTQQTVEQDTGLVITKLGRACVAGNIDLAWAGTLHTDLELARPSVHLDTSLHLLYLVTPYDLSVGDRQVYTANNYHAIYEQLSEPERAVARSLGVTEAVMVGLVMGRKNKKNDMVLNRLYYALMLLDLWQATPIHRVAERFQVSRGEVQSLMSSAASFSSSVYYFCQEIEEFWAYQELLEPFSRRLAHCCLPELLPLLDLPGVKIGRARQLHNAGFQTVADIARAQAKQLVTSVEHVSYKVANSLIQAAKLSVLERIDALKDEAEIAMLDLE